MRMKGRGWELWGRKLLGEMGEERGMEGRGKKVGGVLKGEGGEWRKEGGTVK